MGGINTNFLNLFVFIFISAIGVATSYIINRRSQKTEKAKAIVDRGKLELDNRREDGAAYERASGINQQIVDSLRKELTNLQETVQQLRTDLDASHQKQDLLEKHVHRLEGNVSDMKRLLDTADIPYPPGV